MSASDLTIPTLQAPAVNSPVGGALRRRFVWLSSALLLCVQWPASVADTHQVSSPTALNLLALNMVDRGSYRSRQGFEYTKVVPKFLQQLNERVLGGQRASTSCPEDSAGILCLHLRAVCVCVFVELCVCVCVCVCVTVCVCMWNCVCMSVFVVPLVIAYF